jgi:hypothetical protein
MIMNRKLKVFSCLLMSILFTISFVPTAEAGIIVKGADGEEIRVEPVKMRVKHEPIQAELDLGQLTAVKYILDVAVIEDEQKDVEARGILGTKIRKAKQLYEQYVGLKEKANGDMTVLLEAKEWLKKANTIWTDNSGFQQAQREIDNMISRVESGCYDIDRSRENSEQEILQLIDESRSCKVNEDCKVTGFGCPFGCSSAFNKEKIPIIESRIIDHNAKYSAGKCGGGICMYDCSITPDKVKCIDNQCSTRF